MMRFMENSFIMVCIALTCYMATKETKDFRLMMNLLSERAGTEGLAQSFRLLTIFDKHFKRLWTPNDVRILDEDISSPTQKYV